MNPLERLELDYQQVKARGGRAELLAKMEVQIARLRKETVTEEQTVIAEAVPPAMVSEPSIKLTQADIDDYRAQAIKEIHLKSSSWGDIFIVLEKTGGSRIEFTPEEILKMVQLKNMFGGEVIDVRKDPRPAIQKTQPGETMELPLTTREGK